MVDTYSIKFLEVPNMVRAVSPVSFFYHFPAKLKEGFSQVELNATNNTLRCRALSLLNSGTPSHKAPE